LWRFRFKGDRFNFPTSLLCPIQALFNSCFIIQSGETVADEILLTMGMSPPEQGTLLKAGGMVQAKRMTFLKVAPVSS